MDASSFVPAAPHLQQQVFAQQGNSMAVAFKNALKQQAVAAGVELPGHAGLLQLAQQAGVDPGDQQAMTAMLAQAVGAPAEQA